MSTTPTRIPRFAAPSPNWRYQAFRLRLADRTQALGHAVHDEMLELMDPLPPSRAG